MTVEQFIADLDELVDAVCERLDKTKMAIFGHSWGSVRTGGLTRARPGTFLLDIRRFHGLDEGRACPRVPYLTYPFCTRLYSVRRRGRFAARSSLSTT
jgi:hypothetical protein